MTTKTYNRIVKMINAGKYDAETLMLDMADFVRLNTLTEEQLLSLTNLIESTPQTLALNIEEDGSFVSDNTYLLLQRQILKEAYSIRTIEQLTTDFRLTNAISREQFNSLIALIEEVYFPPVVEEDEVIVEE